MFGFAIKIIKGNKYICITKDGECDFTNHDYAYIRTLLPKDIQTPVENVYLILNYRNNTINIEDTLLDVGFIRNEPRAKSILKQMKEQLP